MTDLDFDRPEIADDDTIRILAEHMPLGLLSVAAVLEAHGRNPKVVDLNRWYLDFYNHDRNQSDDFCDYVVDRLVEVPFDLIGLSTICSSYPLTIRIATAVKERRPSVVVVLGGPQATVTDVATMTNFPSVDYVVRGEAEETFPVLLDRIEEGRRLKSMLGVTYRIGSTVIRAPNAPVINDLDSLPMPAFHLYPNVKELNNISLELGRGCPFACTFCSTNDFFRRTFRLKSPQKMLEQMGEVKSRYGVTTFDLVHDMFTVDRKRVVKFCQAIIDSGESYRWGCSARTDCVDQDLLELMWDAGCRGVFFGIETGSARLQKIVNKKIDLEVAMDMIDRCDFLGIKTAVSLIAGFPDETEADLRDTVAFLVESSRFPNADPQFHLLAPLIETPIFSKYRNELRLDDFVSDMSYQGWQQQPADRHLIEKYVDVFGNFYSTPTNVDRIRLGEIREFLLNGTARMRWLMVALHLHHGHLIDVFDDWREWRRQRNVCADDSDSVRAFYADMKFVNSFLQYVEQSYLPGQKGIIGILALLEYERGVSEIAAEDTDTAEIDHISSGDQSSEAIRAPFGADSIPKIAEGVHLISLGADFSRLVACLRRRGYIRRIRKRNVLLAVRSLDSEDRTDVVQLSRLSGLILKRCNGAHSVTELVAELATESEICSELGDIPAESACRFGLEVLRNQGLITSAE